MEEDEEEGWKQSSKNQGHIGFFLVYFVFKSHHQIFLHWNNIALTKDNLTKDAFVTPLLK